MNAPWPDGRRQKFRQAAFAYLHVAVLYEAAAYVMMGEGILPSRFGPPWLWLVIGAAVAATVFGGLYWWQNQWFARAIWMMHGLRLPALIGGAFFGGPDARMPPAFYVTAIVIVVANLWMLARAGWDV